jgi:hypothetical protein
MQILLGLQSPAISSLEKTWQKIDSYEAQIFNDLKELAKPFRNWKNVRDCMTKATEEVAETSAVESVLTNSQVDFKDLDTTHGCIPFLGKKSHGISFLIKFFCFFLGGNFLLTQNMN